MKEISLSLLVAVLITIAIVTTAVTIWFLSFATDTGSEGGKTENNLFLSSSGTIEPDTRPVILRVLRYNATGKTYRFTDHDLPSGEIIDPAFDTLDTIPIPDRDGPVVPAMIQVLLGDENERTIEHTRFILPVESVQEIISQYRQYGAPTPVPTPVRPETPVPTILPEKTAAMQMIIPITEYVCNNGDLTCTAHFSYISRHDTPVTLRTGPDNHFSLNPGDRGQPEVFYPGYQHDIFSVRWPSNSTPIVWHLAGGAARAEPTDPLKCRIHVEPTEGFVPLTITGTEHGTGSSGSTAVYTWNLGGKTTSNERVVTHTYREPGTYLITCTVSDRCGTASSGPVVVDAYQAAFSWEPDSSDPRTIRFYDTTTGTPDAWYWVFGERDIASFKQNPVHTYAKPGTYQVGLKVHVGSVSKQIVHQIQIR